MAVGGLNFNSALSGARTYETSVNIISNNLANANTIAFQRQRPVIKDLLYVSSIRAGALSSAQDTVHTSGIHIGQGSYVDSVYRIAEQGELLQTGNPLDVSIKGKGWFRVELPNGDFAYTRDGSFQTDNEGRINSSQGFTIAPGIQIPAEAYDGEVQISGDGIVSVKMPGQLEPQVLGQITLYNFISDKGLEPLGDNLFKATEASGEPVEGFPRDDGFGSLRQGWLEGSNVNMITELTELIKYQRNYEHCITCIQTVSDMLKETSNMT